MDERSEAYRAAMEALTRKDASGGEVEVGVGELFGFKPVATGEFVGETESKNFEIEPRVENRRFIEVMQAVEVEASAVVFSEQVTRLNQINFKKPAKDMHGIEQKNSRLAFLEIAAHLKIFNEDLFEVNRDVIDMSAKTRVDEIQPLLESFRHQIQDDQSPDEQKAKALGSYLKYLYYAKVLYPKTFENSEKFIGPKVLTVLEEVLSSERKQSHATGWDNFFKYYEYLAKLSPNLAGDPEINGGLSQEDWVSVTEFALRPDSKGKHFPHRAAWAELVRPKGDITPIVDEAHWQEFIGQSKKSFDRQDYGKFFVTARYLKDLRVDGEE